MARLAWVSVLSLIMTGCTVRTPEPGMDAGRDAARPDVPLSDVGRDVGSTDALLLDVPADGGSDAPLDASDAPTDAGSLDAGSDAGTDAGRDAGADAGRDAGLDGGPGTDAPVLVAPTIDGVIAAGEWAAGTTAIDLTVTGWTGNELRALRVLIADGSLYLALEGRIEGGNAMVVYVDRDLDEAVGIASLATLTDNVDALDAAVTAALSTPASFRTDLIFGTLDLSRAATGSDARMGWRDLNRAASLADLFWVTAAVAPVACSATACETRIPLTEVGGTSPRRMGLFARIVNSDGSMSPNQTLPSDDGAMPRTVSAILELAE